MTDKAGNWGVEALRLRLDDPPSIALQPKPTTSEFVVERIRQLVISVGDLQACVATMVEPEQPRAELLRRLGEIKLAIAQVQTAIAEAR